MRTYRQVYEEGVKALSSAEINEAKLDAKLLLEGCCHTDTQTLLAHGDRPVTEEEESSYHSFLTRRSAHEPVAYILEEQEFMGLPFHVTSAVLIPNQDTEVLVEEMMQEVHDGMRILDVCTGSGCILLSLLNYSNDTTGVAIDLSGEALAIAKENAERLSLSARCTFLQGDLLSPLSKEDKFEVIVSNPPYIPTGVIPSLAPEVAGQEPYMALCGGDDGLDFYRRLVVDVTEHLVIGGVLAMEIGFDQGTAVSMLMKENGYIDVEVIKDYAGLDRVVRGYRSLHTR